MIAVQAAAWIMFAMWDNGTTYSMAGAGLDSRQKCVQALVEKGWDKEGSWGQYQTTEPSVIGCYPSGSEHAIDAMQEALMEKAGAL